MRRASFAPRARLISLVICLSLLAQSLLPTLAGASTGSGAKATKTSSPVAAKAKQQAEDAQAADLPDINEARNRPGYEPRAVPPVPSTRRLSA